MAAFTAAVSDCSQGGWGAAGAHGTAYVVIVTQMTPVNPTGQGWWANNDEQWDSMDNEETMPCYQCPNFLTSYAREVFRFMP